MDHSRTIILIAVACALLIAPSGDVGAAPVSPSRIENPSAIEFVQDRPKSETVGQEVKRIWRSFTAYKFDVACPSFTLALTRTSCSTNGKNRGDARAKCQSQNAFCEIRDAIR